MHYVLLPMVRVSQAQTPSQAEPKSAATLASVLGRRSRYPHRLLLKPHTLHWLWSEAANATLPGSRSIIAALTLPFFLSLSPSLSFSASLPRCLAFGLPLSPPLPLFISHCYILSSIPYLSPFLFFSFTLSLYLTSSLHFALSLFLTILYVSRLFRSVSPPPHSPFRSLSLNLVCQCLSPISVHPFHYF